MKKHTELLGSEKVPRLLLRLSLPATVGMMVTALYNVVDTIFVGQAVGPLAIAALAVVFPIQAIVRACALTLGVGGSSIISRSLGAGRRVRAELTFGNLISATIAIGLLLTLVFILLKGPILSIFGGRGDIYAYADEYFSIILWGTPFICFAMMANNVIRSEGNARTAMKAMLISALINLILDPIFIFGFDMGMTGAGIATVISQIFTAIYQLLYFLNRKSALRIKFENLQFNLKVIRRIIAIGMSSFSRQISASILALILNNSLLAYGDEMTVAMFGVINRVIMMTLLPMFGIAQGFMPVCGYNYGAGKISRVFSSIKVSVIAASSIAVVGFLVLMLFPDLIFSIFTSDDYIISTGTSAMRVVVMALPLVGLQVVGSTYFQALGMAYRSIILSLTRQILFLIPLTLILPVFYGLDGIWYAFPLADGLAVIITVMMTVPAIRKLAKENDQTS